MTISYRMGGSVHLANYVSFEISFIARWGGWCISGYIGMSCDIFLIVGGGGALVEVHVCHVTFDCVQ